MRIQDRMIGTGESVVLRSDRAPGFEWCKFESCDAPDFSPAGSMFFIETSVIDVQGAVVQTCVGRGW